MHFSRTSVRLLGTPNGAFLVEDPWTQPSPPAALRLISADAHEGDAHKGGSIAERAAGRREHGALEGGVGHSFEHPMEGKRLGPGGILPLRSSPGIAFREVGPVIEQRCVR